MNSGENGIRSISRRRFLRDAALGASAVAVIPILGCRSDRAKIAAGPASRIIPLDNDWLFGGKFSDAAMQPAFDDSAFERVSLPHCVSKLSWQGWQISDWADVWIYRRHFSLPKEIGNQRVFLHFDGVMTGATPVINGHALPEHLGGYLPFHYEITNLVAGNDNVLAVAIDSRWSNVPPEGNPNGPISVDFLEAGGIPRPVALRVLPQVFISDVFAKPVNVLDASRRVEISCTLDAALVTKQPARLKVEMFDAGRRIAVVSQDFKIEKTGKTELKLTLADLGNIKLWDVNAPQLYELVTTLILDEELVHDYRTRIGFREAKFEPDGFFLNGRRLQLFGLNRHEIYPYVGFAMPPRVMRRDVEILRHELNCNIVRCSHYPQSEAFLDACDELGLLVWEEMPGWQYIGDAAWQDLAVRDVESMIRRDRNHSAIVIWGIRVNESKNDPAFYQRTTAAGRSMDDSRHMSGAIVGGLHSTKDWDEDVFAYNDYSHDQKTGKLELKPPLAGVPYLLTEAVGQIVGIGPSADHMYRRAGDPVLQAKQAIYHAQVHDLAGADKRYAGVIAWCGFEYASPVKVSYNDVKYPGVADIFRIPKLGASFYQAQVSPQLRPVIQPNFYWDFGPKTPRGPGKNAAIFSNCDRLEVFVSGAHTTTLQPQRDQFPSTQYPPFFIDLDLDGAGKSELRLDGYVGDKLVLSRSFSSDENQDQFLLRADDVELAGNGFDATRLVFGRVDKFGSVRLFGDGEVSFQLSGPGTIVGDNPFQLADAGGIAAVWIKAFKNGSGLVEIVATHSTLGKKSVEIKVTGK
jgi:beta-galactosidase